MLPNGILSTALTRSLRSSLYRQCQRTAHTSGTDDRDLPEMRGTHLNLLNDPDEDYKHLYINQYSKEGFTLSTGLTLKGPVIFFPRSFLAWKVKNASEINENSLSLFKTIHPKLDILLLGIGSAKQRIGKDVLKFLRENKINFEILPTEKAIPSFNFLSAEQRWVAAALIPPDNVQDSLSDIIKEQLDQADLEARLEMDDEEEDSFLEYEMPKKEIPSLDEQFTSALVDDELEKTNMFGYKINYLEQASSTNKPHQVKEQKAITEMEEDSTIRFIRKSEMDKKAESLKNIPIVRSPLEAGWKSDESVGSTEVESRRKQAMKSVETIKDMNTDDKTQSNK